MGAFEAHGLFEPTPASIAEARHLARPLLALLPAEMAECLELVVSELATNAVRHAATPYELTVSISPTVRVEVSDASSDLPVRQYPDLTDSGGRGLLIVDTCAEHWGVKPLPQG